MTGPYPERTEQPPGVLDRPWHKLRGAILRRWPATAGLRAAVREATAHGPAVREMTDVALAAEARALGASRVGHEEDSVRTGRLLGVLREACRRQLGMEPYDVQLMGACALLQGYLAEMDTGEGKTLTAGIAAAAAALSRTPTHVVTVNDYLAERDAALQAPLYRALGLRVGVVTENTPREMRGDEYRRDITYCTAKDLVFDYLRDRLVLAGCHSRTRLLTERLASGDGRLDRLVLTGLRFAIVDEADSILVDEARTPLVISGPAGASSTQPPYAAYLHIARALRAEADFHVDLRRRRVVLTRQGFDHLLQQIETLGHALPAQYRLRQVAREYVVTALGALHLYARDRDYIVMQDKVHIVDEYTGRTLADRSWEGGLQQFVERKEGCPETEGRTTLAQISYQRFFRRFARLAGMTGTAREVAGELWNVYQLRVVRIPNHRPSQRVLRRPESQPDAAAKWRRVADLAQAASARGQPVLVGTRTVHASEEVSACFRERGVPHQLLNARQDAEEAALVAQAGVAGTITVATNMAGRGTDIKLDEAARAAGGLLVIATELHDSRRVDRQLYGRSGRQGDPGLCLGVISLDDALLTVFLGPFARELLATLAARDLPCTDAIVARLARHAQQRAEAHFARVREQMVEADRRTDRMLAFAGAPE
jgi:preprotein translocase subunit SecA